MQSRQLQENVGNHTDKHDHHARHQHSAEEGHIFTGGQHVGRAAEEHQRGTAQRQANQIAHTRRQVGVKHWPQDVAQKTGKGERGNDTRWLIRGFIGQEHQAVHTDQRQNQTRRRQHQHRAGRRRNSGKCQRQAKQEIGVPQNFVRAK